MNIKVAAFTVSEKSSNICVSSEDSVCASAKFDQNIRSVQVIIDTCFLHVDCEDCGKTFGKICRKSISGCLPLSFDFFHPIESKRYAVYM